MLLISSAISCGSLSKSVTLRDTCPAALACSPGLLSWLVAGMETFSLQGKIDLPLLSTGSLYFVVRAYESQKADELSLNNGVVVEVVKKSDDGWWLIR